MSVRVKQYEAINGTTIISVSVRDILALGGGGARTVSDSKYNTPISKST